MPTSTVAVDIETAVECAPVRRRGERGQGMVEYAFILLLVAMVIIISLTLLGTRTSSLYSNISSGLGP